ncbi:sulfatase [Bremerella alba]|uniref:Arylsulfatase n=1 Tax=Bremerella alba TaxID=980252 RepID=A0A7V8V7Q4_9BACT|nr:sulfatase [Bremerella alba]MBA2116519.1 Arylsulfatase [Bremerella alba]
MIRTTSLLLCLLLISFTQAADKPPNVLFIISDDLTPTALSCYGNEVSKTPNIDRLAAQGTRFSHAYCNATYCGPSRASFLSGYYPHATGVFRYVSPRPQIGDRAMWPQHFKNNGYHTARVSKIFHMSVPGGIERGESGPDDPACWHERYNSPGPEWKAPGDGETLENNPDGKKPAVGGNTFVVVEADGDDEVHSDGKTAAKAVQLIQQHAKADKPFFLAVGFVRPHVPFVAPAKYMEPYKPYADRQLPEKVAGDWDDIPKLGINYRTSKGMQMDIRRQKKAVGGYYGAVAFLDAQVGKVLDALEASGEADNTIVIFTSDHGYHLGQHDFWAKVSLHEESASVPLIIKVPGQKPAVCDSLTQLLDLYPTTAALCGLEVPARLQGKDITPLLKDPQAKVHDEVLNVSPMQKGFLLRSDRWAFIQYKEDGTGGIELFDMENDPQQYKNLADDPKYLEVVKEFQQKLAAKLADLRENDL